jgi:hypothetical protein
MPSRCGIFEGQSPFFRLDESCYAAGVRTGLAGNRMSNRGELNACSAHGNS